MEPKKPIRKKLKEGMAECVFVDGCEDLFTLGEFAWVKEICNMPGHCIILRNGKLPLVGYHLDRFRILKKGET